jgi:hypothetical protein
LIPFTEPVLSEILQSPSLYSGFLQNDRREGFRVIARQKIKVATCFFLKPLVIKGLRISDTKNSGNYRIL